MDGGINISSKKKTTATSTGRRMECIAAFILAGYLCNRCWHRLFRRGKNHTPGAICGAQPLFPDCRGCFSVVKEAMYWYTVLAAKKINSASLGGYLAPPQRRALLCGKLCRHSGCAYGLSDSGPDCKRLICLMIIKVSYDIVRDAIDKLVDKSIATAKQSAGCRQVIMEQEGVEGVDLLKTRLFGSKIYVDVEICADGNQTLIKAIAENVHHALERDFPDVKHCMVHVNPKQNKPELPPEQ